jgi:hypothetical protein
LARNTGKAEIIDWLLEYADQKMLLKKLLTWAKDNNPARYKEYQPYYYRAHLFISYKHDVEPDEPVARQVFEALSQQYEVFIDKKMMVGTPWIEHIKAELHRTDFLIIFLSAESICSEMVLDEIKIAHQLAQEQAGRPAMLPVRLAYREPFQYPLSEYLNPINWAFWESEADTPRLIEELKQAVSGGALSIDEGSKAAILQVGPPPSFPQPLVSAQPVRLIHLEMPEGTMAAQSTFYVERPSDRIALGTIETQGVTLTIKAPRQMGKSSLLVRTTEVAAKAGKQVAFLDFQLFENSALTEADTFFRQFCARLTDTLELEDRVVDYWEGKLLGNSQNCTRYVDRYLLRELGRPLVLAMDEVESVFDTDFRDDFFGMLRNWHNNRAIYPIWKQLDLLLVTSTEPYQLIKKQNQSPFNVGEVIELKDFTAEQVADLNRRHSSPLTSDQERQLMGLVGGHPYLIRRALYLVASQRLLPVDLFAQATAEQGPFRDHLYHHLLRLYDRPELVQGLRQVIRYHTCQDQEIFFRLQGAGLIRREGREVWPRCQLYADFFTEHLPS